MGIEISSSGGDGFFDDVFGNGLAAVEEQLASELAETARAEGMPTVDEIALEVESGDPSVKLDEPRIRRLANEKLARGTG